MKSGFSITNFLNIFIVYYGSMNIEMAIADFDLILQCHTVFLVAFADAMWEGSDRSCVRRSEICR